MAKSVVEQIAALKTRIEADTAKLRELETAEKSAEAMQKLAAGDVVGFMYGRGETRKQYIGEVRAVFDTDKGKRVKVLAGEGVDEEIFVIEPSSIVFVGEEVQEADAPAGNVAAADPLAGLN